MTEYIVAVLAGVLLGGLVGLLLGRKGRDTEALNRIQAEADERIAAERTKAEAEATEAAKKRSEATDKRLAERREHLKAREIRLSESEKQAAEKEAQLSKELSQMKRREKETGRRERRLTTQEEQLSEAVTEAREQMATVASMSQDEARAILLDEVRDEARAKAIDDIRAIEKEARDLAEERARLVLSAAIQRFASEHVSDRTVASVELPSEDMKGRIIGREGRNIRAFEAASGCDVIIDDAPGTVVVSSFNPVRREIGRLSMKKLLSDGRIHPARIEEVVARTRKEMDKVTRKRGEEAAAELEITGLHPEILRGLGQLSFATSFAQNLLRHSIEVAFLAGMMASELGLNPKQARRAGLLHDIGKAVDQAAEGDHAEVGASFLRKHSEKKEIVHAVLTHHNVDAQKTILAQLVGAANQLSTERPGARKDALAKQISRLEELENLVSQFEGAETVHAIRAGSEIRVMVDNARLSDRKADLLSRDIARRIEQELSYPSDIKVVVIRSSRAVSYAR